VQVFRDPISENLPGQQKKESKEGTLDPELVRSIDALSAHEGAHAFVSVKLGIPLMRLETAITRKGDHYEQLGGVAWSDLRGVSTEARGISYTAGLAGELFIMGEEYVRRSGFRGLRTDSKRLNALGYTTQEQKAELLTKALRVLADNREEFYTFCDNLRVAIKEATHDEGVSLELTSYEISQLMEPTASKEPQGR